MHPSGQTVSYLSRSIHSFDIAYANDLMDCSIFWLRIVSSESESLTTKNTKHSFYELQYALQGSIHMRIGDGDELEIPESHFLIVPPNTYHQVTASCDCGARFIMAFSLDFHCEAGQTAEESIRCLQPRHDTAGMQKLLSWILEMEHENSPFRRKMITTLVESLLLETFEILCSTSGPAHRSYVSTERNQLVDAISSYIQETGGIGISVADIASKFDISQRQLHRLFAGVTGHGLSEAIALEKLKKIEYLIGSTSFSFQEIADMCGFSDGYAMNKFFKRHNRVNLSDFRALAKKKETDSVS